MHFGICLALKDTTVGSCTSGKRWESRFSVAVTRSVYQYIFQRIQMLDWNTSFYCFSVQAVIHDINFNFSASDLSKRTTMRSLVIIFLMTLLNKWLSLYLQFVHAYVVRPSNTPSSHFHQVYQHIISISLIRHTSVLIEQGDLSCRCSRRPLIINSLGPSIKNITYHLLY